MNFRDYISLAIRTESNKSFSEEERYQHVAMGLITEMGELTDIFKKNKYYGKEIDIVNLKEEIGDISWYTALGYHLLDGNGFVISPPAYDKIPYCRTKFQVITHLNLYIADYCDASGDIHQQVDALMGINQTLTALCYWNHINYDECLEINIKKLQVRYPEKYDDASAINRDLESEKSILNSFEK